MRFKTRNIVSAVLAMACLTTESVHATPFVHEIVDATGDIGIYGSLALDSRGRPRISYFDDTNDNLKFAQWNAGVWTIETVESTNAAGLYTSLAIDAQGNPHISYSQDPNGDLKYAVKIGGIWTIETVDAANVTGWDTSIALDAQGNPRISYYDSTTDDLRYAAKNAGVWASETVDATGNVGQYTSLELDAMGRPHVSYYDVTNANLKYASKTGPTWNVVLVDTTGSVGVRSSLVLDAQGNPRISYFDATNSDLKFAFRTGSVWTAELVDGTLSVGGFSSLGLDGSGNPRVAYSDATNADLKYAVKSGGTWTLETVEAANSVGTWVSMALDAQGNPRACYYDTTNQDLRYTDSAVRVVAPFGGETWPVGALRTITWAGSGAVDLFLSADGGVTSSLLLDNVQGSAPRNSVTVRVPHLPTRFARLEVRRGTFFSTSPSDSIFTIESSIDLLSFTADPPSATHSGVRLEWATQPGPEDLAGYRVERRSAAAPTSEPWTKVSVMTTETSLVDSDGGAGSRYRLIAVNGLGGELVLGEVDVRAAAALAVWPLPYRDGTLIVAFETLGSYGGSAGFAEVAIYDLQGRLVRTIARGTFEPGSHRAEWDGRDAAGRPVANGVYFVRSESAGLSKETKIVVLR